MFISTTTLTGAAGVLAMPVATGVGRRDRTKDAGQRDLAVRAISLASAAAVNEWTTVEAPSSEPVPCGGADG